jgi:predicted small metal-binding protein
MTEKRRRGFWGTLGCLVRCRRCDDGFWDDKFNALATYNAEVSRGIVHTLEWKHNMRYLQAEYNNKLRAHYGIAPNAGGEGRP